MLTKILSGLDACVYQVSIDNYQALVHLRVLQNGVLGIAINGRLEHTIHCNFSEEHKEKTGNSYAEVMPTHIEYNGKVGEEAIYEYVRYANQRWALQQIRQNYIFSLHRREIISKRFHDIETKTYFRCTLPLCGRFSLVFMESSEGWLTDDIRLRSATEKWKNASRFFTEKFNNKYANALICDLSIEDFSEMLEILASLK